MNRKLGLLLAIYIPFIAQSQHNPFFTSQKGINRDSLLLVSVNSPDPLAQVAALRELGQYYYENKRDSALSFFEEQKSLARKSGLKLWEADALVSIGFVSYTQSNYPKSLQSLIQAKKIAEDPSSEKDPWLKRAQWVDAAGARKSILARMHNHFASLYGFTGNFRENSEKELFHFKQGIPFAREAGDSTMLAILYMNLTRHYAYGTTMLDSVEHYFRIALELIESTGYTRYKGGLMHNMGAACLRQGRIPDAQSFFWEGLKVSVDADNARNLGENSLSLSEIHRLNGAIDSSLYYARKALHAYTSTRILAGQANAYTAISAAYRAQGKIDSAFFYQSLSIQTQEKLDATDKSRRFQQISFDEQLRAQELIEEQRQYRNRLVNYALLAGLFILSVTGWIVYRTSLARKKANEQLQKKNHELAIESSLEKVRAQSLAMHKSDELRDVVTIMFHELEQHGFFVADGAVVVVIFKDNEGLMSQWIADPGQAYPTSFDIPFTDHPMSWDIEQARKKGIGFFSKMYTKAEKNNYFNFLFEKTNYGSVPDKVKDILLGSERYGLSAVFAKNSGILIPTNSGRLVTEEQKSILARMANVFDQAYTRFLDLQKAETHAREANIETALERIRARVMAMNRSEELKETSLVFGEQLRKLGIDWQFSYFWLVDEPKDENVFWITWPDNNTSVTTYTIAEAAEYFNECLVEWRKGTRIHDNIIPLPGVQAWLDTFQRITEDAGGIAHDVMQANNFPDGVFYYDAMMKYGSFGICIRNPATEEEKNIQARFAIEFERAYTRFLDLKNAEQQAHLARIETALERVRARALAMQEPEELVDVARMLRHEMGLLGIESLETGTVFIHDQGSAQAECWFAIKDDRLPDKPLVSDHISLDLHATWVGRQMLEFYNREDLQVSIPMKGNHRREWIEYCYGLSQTLKGFYGEHIPDRTYHLFKFSNGAIGAAAPGDISVESWELLQRTASVFSLAYSRFKDLTQARIDLQRLKEEKQRAETALTELKATQTQLIQSEKMASLGELTAGIAHEIQNPLNFVNNFSEINAELADEIADAVDKGDMEEIRTLASDIKSNQEKIREHGKRADSIVKSMLQHSRSTTGQKEPTDINRLAEEYLRLAYHGLRAKDKSFNASIETDFDKGIGLMPLMPQEIGRVLLNLFNNAFYAVNEKSKTGGPDYQPTVTVTTRSPKGHPSGNAQHIVLTVTDNGNGIPDAIKDKIFQPFFTTKPTGQGTGLGLSLSYDIVKAHGGDIKVETAEGSGTTFIIQLPNRQ